MQRSEQAVHEIARFCAAHNIEAELRVEGTCYTATSEAQRGLMEPVLRELQRADLNQWQAIEEDELASQSGSHVHLEGSTAPTRARCNRRSWCAACCGWRGSWESRSMSTPHGAP